MSCSMLPVSHSRATVSEVSSAAMSIMITAMRPGTMKIRDSMSVLNQARNRRSRGRAGGRPERRRAFSTRSSWE